MYDPNAAPHFEPDDLAGMTPAEVVGRVAEVFDGQSDREHYVKAIDDFEELSAWQDRRAALVEGVARHLEGEGFEDGLTLVQALERSFEPGAWEVAAESIGRLVLAEGRHADEFARKGGYERGYPSAEFDPAIGVIWARVVTDPRAQGSERGRDDRDLITLVEGLRPELVRDLLHAALIQLANLRRGLPFDY